MADSSEPLVHAHYLPGNGVNVLNVLSAIDAEGDETHTADTTLPGEEADDSNQYPCEYTSLVPEHCYILLQRKGKISNNFYRCVQVY